MDVATHIAELDQHGRGLADAAAAAGLDVEVPTCPEWTVRALLAHVGMVHRWATGQVRDGERAFNGNTESPTFPAPEVGVVDWFRVGHTDLVEALRAAPEDLVAMTFLADAGSPLSFWARRQAHETAIHRSDAEAALGTVPSFDAEFALDGIAELLVGFYSRGRGRLVSDPPVSLRVAPTDAETSWLVEIRPDGRTISQDAAGTADATISGRAADLYLELWNRGAPDQVTITGDENVLALWRRLARINWG